jgi:gamma-glutamyl hercynylcysteine S-oxide synthase
MAGSGVEPEERTTALKGEAVSPIAPAVPVDRERLIDWYQRNRERSRRLFDLLDPDAYYTRPISLRNPIVFYEGHLPAFSVISLLKRGLGHPGVDQAMERLFERGIDPDSVDSAVPRSGAGTVWPSREDVLTFGRRADEAMIEALGRADFERAATEHSAMRRGEAIFTALEHEAMHQETLLYMWHRLPHNQKSAPRAGLRYERGGDPPPYATATIPAGVATLGADRATVPFGWDNEFDEHQVEVGGFEIDVYNVTNADFLSFIDAGGYRQRELWSEGGWQWREQEDITHPAFWERDGSRWDWRGMFENIALPEAWPVYVSYEEASAFARWRGRRLPTEAEYHRAAFGTPSGPSGATPERRFPWGDAPPDATRGNFDFASWDPIPVGARPRGASAWGVHDLVGNGWEWTSTIFGPFPGFEPMASYPEYSADFFDGQHYVIKGASPATASELVRPSFRNWFRPNYPFVYAGFRTAIS